MKLFKSKANDEACYSFSSYGRTKELKNDTTSTLKKDRKHKIIKAKKSRSSKSENRDEAYDSSHSQGSLSSGDSTSGDSTSIITRDDIEERSEISNTENSLNESLPPRPAPSKEMEVTERQKASTIRDLRRSLSKESENYVHVFHDQLRTLHEDSGEEETTDDDAGSETFCEDDDDDFSLDAAMYMKHKPFTNVLDEEKLRERWHYAMEIQKVHEKSS